MGDRRRGGPCARLQYGAHVRLRWQTWRVDTNRGTTPPPAGPKLRFTVRLLSPTVDGQRLAPFVVERDSDPRAGNQDLNDLPPADLEITGVVLLPDGSRKPMRFQGRDDYPNFKPALQAPLTPGGVGGAYAPLNATPLQPVTSPRPALRRSGQCRDRRRRSRAPASTTAR